MCKTALSSASPKTARDYEVMGDRTIYPASAARWLSRVFHPFFVAIATVFLTQMVSGYSVFVSLFWTVVSFLIVIAPALTFILIRVRRGRYKDVDVSIRQDRATLYILGGSCMILAIIVLAIFQAPVIAQKTLQAGFFSVIVGSLVNRFVNKISLHVLTVAGCAGMLFFVAPITGLLLGVISLLVAWSRIYLARHTLAEVVWGWCVGVVSTVVWLIIAQQIYARSL